MNNTRFTCTAALVTSILAAATGCSSDGGSRDASSSGKAPSVTSSAATVETTSATVTLTIGTDDSPGVPSADQIQHFVAEVNRLSEGRVIIEPKWHAEGDTEDDWDQAVAKMVQSGKLDLALGPTWAWDVLDVTTLQPLQTPFLVDSDQLVAGIVGDSDLSDRLLSGLPGAGVDGISLWPEGLRHPFGFEHPLLHPDDFAGKVIRSPLSTASASVFEALGATVSPAEPDATTMAGTQSEFVLSPNGTGVANVTFFPKVNVLYANSAVWAGLDTATRALLAQAATTTQGWAIEQTSDVAAGETFCTDGGAVVTASQEQITALRTATQSVADAIAAEHAETIAAITELKDSLPAPAAAKECAGTTTEAEHEAGAAESALNGTYRFTITTQEILDAGGDAGFAANNEGVQNFVLQDGTITFRLDPTARPADETDSFTGTYQVDGDVLTLRFPSAGQEIDTLRFTADADGNLQVTFVDSNASGATMELMLAGKLWERIE